MKRNLFFTVFSLLILSNISGIAQWRGPNRDGIYPETNLLKSWPESGPKLLWHFDELGQGFSSVTVTKEAVYTTGMIEGKGYVFCLNHNGSVLWKTEYGKEWQESYPGTRTTPSFFENKLYLLSTYGQAICLDAKTGKQLWNVDMVARFGASVIQWGITESPLIVDKMVIFTPGGNIGNVVALDCMSGKTIWLSKAKGEPSAYCSPILANHKGKKIIITQTASSVIGLLADNGNLLWYWPKTNTWSVHANSPLYQDGMVFITSGYGAGSVMLKISDDGSKISEAWQNTSLDNQMGGSVLLNGIIYASGHENDNKLQAIEWKNGKVRFSFSGWGKGAVISADGMIYAYSEKGEMGLIKPQMIGLELISKFKVPFGSEAHWAHPVIFNGVLYIRHGKSLMAYQVR